MPALPGVSTCAAPEFADSIQRLPEARSRPAAFWNVASDEVARGHAGAAAGRDVAHRAVLADRDVRAAGRDPEQLVGAAAPAPALPTT